MPLEGLARKLFDDIKYGNKFPPRQAAEIKKDELAILGLAHGGALVEQAATIYVEAVERILDGFADSVLSKASVLGLTSNAELRLAVVNAHQQLFDEARAHCWTSYMATQNMAEWWWRSLTRGEGRCGSISNGRLNSGS